MRPPHALPRSRPRADRLRWRAVVDRRRPWRSAPASPEQRVRPEAHRYRTLGVVPEGEAGTPRAVVSSWTPPESVSTSRASASGRGSRGSRAVRDAHALGDGRPGEARAERVRGCREHERRASLAVQRVDGGRAAGSSTFAGRCSVTSGIPPRLEAEPAPASRVPRDRGCASRVSIITLPTRWIASGRSLGAQVVDRVSRECESRRSDTWSVTTRLISSGIDRSKLAARLECATGLRLDGRERAPRASS